LSSIRDSFSLLSSPDPRIIRVSLLDAESLDNELVQLLQDPLNKALATVNSSLKSRFDPELTLIIQLTLYKLSVWNAGATYGAKLQDLRYRVPRISGQALTSSGLPRNTILLHGAITVLFPYIYARLRSHALSNAWPDAPSSDRRRKMWEWLVSLESTHTLLSLLSFVTFLWNGRYRTLTDRLLGMKLVPARKLIRRNVSYEFMNRQMVWHAFTEFLLFLLPLINTRGLRKRFNRLMYQAKPIVLSSLLSASFKISSGDETGDTLPQRGKYWALSEDQCAICAENASYNLNFSDSTNALTSFAAAASNVPSGHDESNTNEPPMYPITTPYITSCGHIYCYYCVAERMLRVADDGDGQGWECLRCNQVVKDADRLEMEIEGSGEDFSSDYDLSEMSGSVGSGYSESSSD